MGVVVEAEIPADEFALWETSTAVEGLEFEIERIVAHDPDRVMPFIWVSGEDVESERCKPHWKTTRVPRTSNWSPTSTTSGCIRWSG